MAEKKIQPKLPTSDEPAAGARKATKTSARRVTNRKVCSQGSAQARPRRSDHPISGFARNPGRRPGFRRFSTGRRRRDGRHTEVVTDSTPPM